MQNNYHLIGVTRRKFLAKLAAAGIGLAIPDLIHFSNASANSPTSNDGSKNPNNSPDNFMKRISLEIIEDVHKRLYYLKTKGKDLLEIRVNDLSSVSRFRDYILTHSHLVPPDFAIALIAKESGGKIKAKSNKGALGLTQMVNETAVDMGLRIGNVVEERFEPEKSIRGGLKYLQQQYEI